MKELFEIDKFNIIEDKENYYFFRALNMGDDKDIEEGTILDKSGKFERIRTDRERYEENNDSRVPKYNKDSKISLEQVYDHIKMRHRKDTNCISLSSNANVAINYGREYYKDKYIIVKVPKNEFGEKVINAGQYMLEEIERKIDGYISSTNINDKLKELLYRIENSKTSEELKEIIQTRYTAKENIYISKARLKKEITYKSPISRISKYKALDDEQQLQKNKIIAKLTILEKMGKMQPIIPHTVNNQLLIQTVGSAFSSLELIHYGDIEKEEIIELPKEIVDIFSLLQQVEGINEQDVIELKREVISFLNENKNFENKEFELLENSDNYTPIDDIPIEEMYELTDGRVDYGIANSVVRNIFYLSKSQSNARELSKVLNDITGNNPKYQEIIKNIESKGFWIEPNIITRRSDRGYRISESLSLDLKDDEKSLVDKIKGLSEEEQKEILEKGGLSNVKNIMSETFSKSQRNEKISKEEYYAEAIVSLYDWQNIGIEELKVEERNNLIQKIKDGYCIELYEKLEKQGIDKKDIPRIFLNMITRKNDFEISKQDTKESIKEKRLKQYDEMLKGDIFDINQEISIERIERFLGYYDVEGTGIQLREYQQKVVEKVDEIFEERRFASVILPTGAGKTFVSLSELIKHKDEKMLYMAPQNEILEQVKDYIVKYIHGPVNTIGRSKEEIIKDVFPNLKFSTYTGLLTKEGKDKIDEKYDLIVLDELHRTGAKKWNKQLDKLIENQTKDIKVLGITATPRRDVDGINMANEMAEKLGYTNKEAVSGKHMAMNMSLTNAIRMGIVVNPKLVTCTYNLKTDGSLERVKEKIESIEDIEERNKKIEEYEKLVKNIENAEGIQEILQTNVKKGEKYIVFLPVVDEIEDEDGNTIGRKKGKQKIKDYEKQIAEYFKGSDIVPNFHSMLGEYGDKENARRLEEFQNTKTDSTELMLVMNKANEGLHLDHLDGIIWLRPLDENSRILYLQQLGRILYALDPDNPIKDEERPKVIDLVNNTLRVKWREEITEQDDIQMLNMIVEWGEKYNGKLPDINSSNKEESRYAVILKEIQEKYKKYLENEDDTLSEKQKEEINEIIKIGSLIDLWEIELSDKIITSKESNIQTNTNNEMESFKLVGVLKDFIELEEEINEINNRTAVDKFIDDLKKLNSIEVDVTEITNIDTIETLAKKSEVDIERVKELGLDPDEKIGRTKVGIVNTYRGHGRYVPPTDKQVKELLDLGISLEKQERDVTQEFIDILKKLKEIGIDITKITNIDTIETLAKKSGIEVEKIKELGLDPDKKIGSTKNHITQAYRGKGSCVPPTDKQVKELLDLGISLEKQERDVTQEFIDILKKLKEVGVDINNIKQRDTIETLAKKSGIGLEKIKELGLDPDEKIGNTKVRIASSYRGKGSNRPPTEEQVKELLDLGISLEKQDVTQEFIDILKKLKEVEVDITKISTSDTIETLAKKSGIGVEKIKELGLDPDEKIGNTKVRITSSYRGKGTNRPPTEEQVKELLDLGISLEKQERDVTQEFIDILKKLKEVGVDINNIKKRDTIETLTKKSGIEVEKIKELGLDPDEKIGYTKASIANAYRGKGDNRPPTEEQVKELLDLGISLEKQERNVTQEFIDILKKLKEVGVDINNIKQRDTIETLAKKSGIGLEKIKELGLDPDEKIGHTKANIARAYRGKGGVPPTEEQVKELLDLGISLEKQQRDVTQEFIDILKKLREIGIDITKITNIDTIETLAKKSGIGVEKIKELGLDPDKKIGSIKDTITRSYRGRRGVPPTEEQVRELLDLGISLEAKKKTGKEIAEASISAVKNIDMLDEETIALGKLSEKTKEEDRRNVCSKTK